MFIKAVRFLDVALRRYYHIEEFTNDEECLIRLAMAVNREPMVLSDGTQVRSGEKIGELHFWNEHVPSSPAEGQDLTWAITFKRRLLRSLRALARHVERDPRAGELQAFRAETSFGGRNGLVCMAKLSERWGFDFVERGSDARLWQSFVHFWENCYETALIRTFNPTYISAGQNIGLTRHEFWISRAALLERYASN